jgi:hypothetical protein
MRGIGSLRVRLAKCAIREINSRIAQDITIFALSHGAHSNAKILFAGGEKDEGANYGCIRIY